MLQDRTLTLPKIGCQGCMKKVVRALSSIPSVEIVSTDVATKSVCVRYDECEVGMPQFETALQTIGHIIALPEREATQHQVAPDGDLL